MPGAGDGASFGRGPVSKPSPAPPKPQEESPRLSLWRTQVSPATPLPRHPTLQILTFSIRNWRRVGGEGYLHMIPLSPSLPFRVKDLEGPEFNRKGGSSHNSQLFFS